MAPTTHTETHPLVFGQEVSFGTIAGPVDFIDVYADGNPAPNAVVEWRVYATVGALVSRVAAGAAGGKQASVIKWSGPQGQYSPIAANGSTYELRAYWAQAGIPPTMKASIVGYDQFDTVADGDGSASEQVPGGFGEVDLVTEDGYSQFADAAVTQSFQGAVRFTLYALSEATTGVEAAIDSVDLINPQDSTTRIFSNVKLPGAVSYTLRANNISTTGVGPTIAASLACYSTAISAAPPPIDGFASIVYRPGAPSSGPYVETWAEVQSLISFSSGRCIIYVDDSIVSPAPVPAISGVTECYGRVEIRPALADAFTYAVLEIEDGATLRNLWGVNDCELRCNCKSATKSLSFAGTPNGGALVLQNEALLSMSTTATQPAIDVAAGSALFVQLLTAVIQTSAIPPGPVMAIPLFSVEGTLDVVSVTSQVQPGYATGSGTVSFQYDDATIGFSSPLYVVAFVPPPLAVSFTGTYTTQNLDQPPQLTGRINFVTDCGADPTGVVDCAPAFDKAYALLTSLAATPPAIGLALRLYMPPGVFALKSAPVATVWDFLNKTTNVEIVGASVDASILQLAGFDPPSITNVQQARIADLTLMGTLVAPANDCVYGFNVQSTQNRTLVERVHFFNLQAQFCAFYSFFGKNVRVRDVSVSCCSSQTDQWGVITIEAAANSKIESSVFEDVGYVNTVAYDGAKLAGNRAWLTVKGNSATAGNSESTTVADCLFDENARRSIAILGDPVSPFRSVVLRNLTALPPIQSPEVACFDVEQVQNLAATGLVNTGFNAASTAVTVKLVAVAQSTFQGIGTSAGTTSNVFSADASCVSVAIEGAPNLGAANILSFATMTRVKVAAAVGDIWCVLSSYLAHGGAAAAVGAALKKDPASVYYTLVAAGDSPGKMLGVAVTHANDGDNVFVALGVQLVPVISDGAAPIFVGDLCVPSATIAGNVTESSGVTSNGTVGVAFTSIVGAGAFTMWLQPGSYA